MGLVLKYAKLTKAGTWQYRRRIPTAVRSILVQGEFKRSLGDTRPEAMRAYPRIDAEFSRVIGSAARRVIQTAQPDTPREVYRAAERLARELGDIEVTIGDRYFRGSDPEAASILRDRYIEALPVDRETGDPVGGDPVMGRALGILSSSDGLRVPAPTLDDARNLYVREKLQDGATKLQKKAMDRLDRLIGVVHSTLGHPLLLSKISREGAKRVRDCIADTPKSTGEAVTPATVKRNLNTVKAVISYAITELELEGKVSNPFNKLTIAGLDSDQTEDEKRDPFPISILLELRAAILSSTNPELGLIWRLLEGTGCRGAEIVGLRVEDLRLDEQFPYIVVTWHEDRRVKSEASRRHVPLVGDALAAATEALTLPRDGAMLFPRYGREGGPDAASQALMKHVRRVTSNERHVVYSLRHNMKDWLRLAEVAALDQNLILGHSLGGVGDRVYGGTPAKLRITSLAMAKAHEVKRADEAKA